MSDSLLIWNANPERTLREDAEAFRALHKQTEPEMERSVAQWHRFTILKRWLHHRETLLDIMFNVNGNILLMQPKIRMGNATGFRFCSPGSHSHVHHEPDPELEHEY